MRTEYEFELGGERFLVKADSQGSVYAYDQAENSSLWVKMGFGPNPFAADLLKLARLLDSYDPWWEKRWAEAPPAVVERAAREKGDL